MNLDPDGLRRPSSVYSPSQLMKHDLFQDQLYLSIVNQQLACQQQANIWLNKTLNFCKPLHFCIINICIFTYLFKILIFPKCFILMPIMAYLNIRLCLCDWRFYKYY